MVLRAIGFDYKRVNLLGNRGTIFRTLRTLTLFVCVCEIRDKAVHYQDHYIVFLGIQSSIRHAASHQSCV